ncbi:hypothetical protein AWB77_06738 [Caballeronia fortuita]|uniref:DUF1640 domain-containing protein n=1 Tax=Caballeronia fortuita TaxID=1777138 RepID=A0A158E8X8_9BURK|nr:hypothetical protein [Caballeronia fortuita]SAL03213.1 hypothetical protein AWB77_06738 [Caballeronia fortuita]
MTTAAFDSHAHYKRMTDGGIPPDQAEATLAVIQDAIASQDARLATKSDVDLAKESMLRAVSDLKAHIVWYMLAFSLGQVALIVGLVKAFGRVGA